MITNLSFWPQEEITEDDIEDGFKNMFLQLAGEVGTVVPSPGKPMASLERRKGIRPLAIRAAQSRGSVGALTVSQGPVSPMSKLQPVACLVPALHTSKC